MNGVKNVLLEVPLELDARIERQSKAKNRYKRPFMLSLLEAGIEMEEKKENESRSPSAKIQGTGNAHGCEQ